MACSPAYCVTLKNTFLELVDSDISAVHHRRSKSEGCLPELHQEFLGDLCGSEQQDCHISHISAPMASETSAAFAGGTLAQSNATSCSHIASSHEQAHSPAFISKTSQILRLDSPSPTVSTMTPTESPSPDSSSWCESPLVVGLLRDGLHEPRRPWSPTISTPEELRLAVGLLRDGLHEPRHPWSTPTESPSPDSSSWCESPWVQGFMYVSGIHMPSSTHAQDCEWLETCSTGRTLGQGTAPDFAELVPGESGTAHTGRRESTGRRIAAISCQKPPGVLTRNCKSYHNTAEPRHGHPGKIFVGGLASIVTTDDLQAYFAAYGEISDVVVMTERSTGHPRGFGFVVFKEGEGPALRAVADWKHHWIAGKWVDVKRSVPAKNLCTPSHT